MSKSLKQYNLLLNQLAEDDTLSVYSKFVILSSIETLNQYLDTDTIVIEEMTDEERKARLELDTIEETPDE